jgi:hypothetical protein
MDTTYDIWLNELRMFRRTRIIVRTPDRPSTGPSTQVRIQAPIQAPIRVADAA